MRLSFLQKQNTSDVLGVPVYLTAQLQQIAAYGPGHVLTWAQATYAGHWLQISVQGGVCCSLTAQFVMPNGVEKKALDCVFRQIGGWQEQAVGLPCVVYHLGRAGSPEELFAMLETLGAQCAEALRLLWGARRTEQIVLLGARGPRIALAPQVTNLQQVARLAAALPRAA